MASGSIRNGRVQRVQELRRSNAATPRPSGKVYKRKAKHPKR
jgi:hypothetical protein